MTHSPAQKLIIITAPSGAGKTSITHYLLRKFPQLSFSVSATTRSRRPYEQEGVDYYFIDAEEFKIKVQQNEFVEWEMVYEGKYYGTLKSEMQRIWKNGQTPMLDIDVQGAIHVKQQYPPDACLSVFIEPPSIDELKRRLQSRNTETPETLADRVSKAAHEISFKPHFDEVILNDDLEKAYLRATQLVEHFLGL